MLFGKFFEQSNHLSRLKLTFSAVMTEAVHLDLRTDQIEARLLDTQSHGLNRCLGNTDFFNALTPSAD